MRLATVLLVTFLTLPARAQQISSISQCTWGWAESTTVIGGITYQTPRDTKGTRYCQESLKSAQVVGNLTKFCGFSIPPQGRGSATIGCAAGCVRLAYEKGPAEFAAYSKWLRTSPTEKENTYEENSGGKASCSDLKIGGVNLGNSICVPTNCNSFQLMYTQCRGYCGSKNPNLFLLPANAKQVADLPPQLLTEYLANPDCFYRCAGKGCPASDPSCCAVDPKPSYCAK
jgi:hypothetical protein